MTEQEFVELKNKINKAQYALEEITYARHIAETAQNCTELKLVVSGDLDAVIGIGGQHEINHFINFLDMRIQYLEHKFRGL